MHSPAGITLNPHHAAAEQQNVSWVQRHSPGMADHDDRLQRLRQICCARLAAFTYPRVGLPELELICNWLTWLFLHDDCYCDGGEPDPDGLAALHHDILLILRGAREPTLRDVSLLHMLADLRRRMLACTDPTWLGRFIVNVDRYLQSTRWEAQNCGQGLTPSLAAYLKMRCFTGAMDSVYDCIVLGEHLRLDPAVRDHTAIIALEQMASNCVCWANDIFSVNKELREHNAHNLVLVLRHEHRLTLAEALAQAVVMHDAERQAFEWAAARLPDLRREFGPDTAVAVQTYVTGLRSWIRGNIAWSWETPRYKGCLSMRGHAAEV